MKLAIPEKLETERLILKRLRYEDAEEIFYAYASKIEATKFVSWPTHETIVDTTNYLRYAIPSWEAGRDYSFSIRLKYENRLIGSVGLVNDFGKAQFGYIISPTHWNKGYATEACKVLLDLLKSLDDVFRIWTFVDVDNTASSNVLQKLGLTEEARLEKWFRFVNQGDRPKDCIFYRV